MKAMIFSAGLGTRLRPLTDTMPKALVPVEGKPLLQWQIEKLKQADITDIVVNIHHFPEQIRTFVENNNGFGCHILFSDETELLLDTGGGLKKAAPLLTDTSPVLVLNVDVLSNINLKQFVEAYRPQDDAALVVSLRETQRYLLFDMANLLRGWHNTATGELKPPSCDAQLKHLAFAGMQIVSQRLLQHLQNYDADVFSVIDFYLHICTMNSLRAYTPPDFQMLDVGKPNALQQARGFL